ncbi:hypothetical protein INT43_004365 [Umbelopsis isabellina]|uniref:Centrosomin N-terminal motif 1 domain-containing protein n=1 Tax=Mortierella isabellina TaxID=91625 RepID=A0A8H7PHZ1_MORIS|nr:hypothetical protein INT43_004365 [Umbelopsis isabellina]
MSSTKPSSGTTNSGSTPRRFQSPSFGSPAGIVIRPTRPQSPALSSSTMTRSSSLYNKAETRRKRVSLTPSSPSLPHRSPITPTASMSTPLQRTNSYHFHADDSADADDHKPTVTMKEFEKIITDLKKENFNLKLRLFHYEEGNTIPSVGTEDHQYLLDELAEQKKLVDDFRVELALAQARIISLEQHLDKPARSIAVQTNMVKHDFDFNENISNHDDSSNSHDSSFPDHRTFFHDFSDRGSPSDDYENDGLAFSRESSISSLGEQQQQQQQQQMTTAATAPLRQQFVTDAQEFGLVRTGADQWDDDINHITRQLNYVQIVTPETKRNKAIGGWLDRIAT